MRFLRLLAYFIGEGLTGIWRHKALHLFAIFVVTVSLFVLGFSRYVTRNVYGILESWQGGLEVRLFLEDSVDGERVRALSDRYARDPCVASVRYISPSEALEVLSRVVPDFASAAGTLPKNPLPASLSLRLKDPVNFGRVRRLTQAAALEPGVAQVLFDWEWVERLRTYTRFVSGVGWTLFAVLGGAALFTVAAITRILALSRREEIAVLHFMGATTTTVRGPFLAGGAALGLLAGVLALLLLAGAHTFLQHAAGPGTTFLAWISQAPLPPAEQFLLALSGCILGGLGGIASLGSSEHWG
jgi:cell division transport system permease protein